MGTLFLYSQMKKIVWIIISVFLLTNCSTSQEKKAANVGQHYLDAVGNYNFDEARKYVTESSLPIIDRMEDFVDMAPEDEVKKNLPVTVNLQQISLNQDTALLIFETKSPLYTHTGSVYLVKNGKKWEVDLPKSFPEK